MDDHDGQPIENFMGLYDRGEGHTIPLDHFSKCHNMMFSGDEFYSRFGFSLLHNIINIKRAFVYKRIGEAPRLIILGDAGKFYDSLDLINPILTIAGCTDFYLVNFYNRAYITPHNGVSGISGEYIYVYNGTGSARRIAGAAPTGFVATFTNGAAGNIEAGLHLFAIAYETDSGFITKPGPAAYFEFTADGSKKCNVANIPTGPAGTVARWILGTEAIVPADYSGNQDDYELFFVHRIDNNVDVAVTIDFQDLELIKSADYLKDLLELVPSSLGLTEFRGRLATWAEYDNTSLVRLSLKGDPESFSEVEGILSTDPKETQSIRCCFEFRDTLYICKPLQTYGAADNGSEPYTWVPISVDKGIGTELFGAAQLLDVKGNSLDKVMVATHQGFMSFVGYYNEEFSQKIHRYWERINKSCFQLVQVLQDSTNKRLYISVPLDSATSCSHVFVGDYNRGLDATNIRWSVWQFPWNPTTIMLDVDNTTSKPVFKIGTDTGVYKSDVTLHNDGATKINSYCQSGPLKQIGGQVQHLGSIRFRVKGSGNLKITCLGDDEAKTKTLKDVPLTALAGHDKVKRTEFSDDRIMIKFEVDNAGDWFKLYHYIPYINVLAVERPQ